MATTHDNPTVRQARRNQVNPTVRNIARELQNRPTANVYGISNEIIKVDEINIGPAALSKIEREYGCELGLTFNESDESVCFHVHGV